MSKWVILITLISCVFYVASWEVIYFKFMPDFADKYAAHAINEMREKGATDSAIAAPSSYAREATCAVFRELAERVPAHTALAARLTEVLGQISSPLG